MFINIKERNILRRLADKQQEIAHSEKSQRVAQWKDHNARRHTAPIVHIEMDTFEEEVINPRLKCESPEARQLEVDLYRNFLNLELFDDDWVVAPHFM